MLSAIKARAGNSWCGSPGFDGDVADGYYVVHWPTYYSNPAVNADGSVDIAFGPQQPTGTENWIATIPGLMLRATVNRF